VTESTDTTYEAACRCPMCREPGKFVASAHPKGTGLRGVKVETYECINARCPNGPQEATQSQPALRGERWLIQVNADGTVPPRDTGRTQPKHYDIDRHTTERQRQNARDQMRRIHEAAIQGGGKV
jgi:hypothetical protein